MTVQNILSRLPAALLPWYAQNKRDLPWRMDKDPYHVWLSEVMLQQTRVEAAKDYYNRFLTAVPTIADLAKIDNMQLHKLWEGLGYYTRVRNLKKAAQQIMVEHQGIFPREYEKILSLPGIGMYTAGAISSIAFNMPMPAVDGNVLRLIARLTDDSTPIDLPAYRKNVHDQLKAIYPESAGDFTQALMELGATVCGPNTKPACGNCPCQSFCLGNMRKTADALPIRQPKRQRRIERYTVFIIRCDDYYALQQRPDEGLLAGLWQFPNVPGDHDVNSALALVEEYGVKPRRIIAKVGRKHIFTHVEWLMNGIFMETDEQCDSFVWFSEEQVKNEIALPTAFRQFWDELEHL